MNINSKADTPASPGPAHGIDVEALRAFATQVAASPAAGIARFGVSTTWEGGTRTRSETATLHLGEHRLARGFVIAADEPPELLGNDTAPNPQELILSALNACMTVGYVAHAAVMGIELRSLTIRSQGSLDLRGFLGLDPAVNPGYDQVEYEVDISSSASTEALESLHARVQRTSPNFHNFARPVVLKARLNIVA